MEKLTDFELEQIDKQLINDGTNTQIRKLVDEVKEYRQLQKIKEIVVEPFREQVKLVTVETIHKAKAFDILKAHSSLFYVDEANNKKFLIFETKKVLNQITQEEYNLLKELGVEEE